MGTLPWRRALKAPMTGTGRWALPGGAEVRADFAGGNISARR